MDDTFEKQRRNLLVTSMLLLLIQFADVTISNDVKTSLLSLKIGKPEVIVYFLYALHLYLITRFFYNRPVESHGIFVLYYHHRMMFLAKRILNIVLGRRKEHQRLNESETQRQRYESGMYDESEEEYLRSLSPDIENQTCEILDKKKITQEVIEKTANEIEHYKKFGYRWQYKEGRYDEELSYTHIFSTIHVLLSYPIAFFTTLFSEHFSRYQLPLLVSVPPVFLFICYMYQL